MAILNGLLFQQSFADSHLVVRAKNADTYCFILPKSRMSIGDSENGSNDLVNSWCTQPYDGQWQLPTDFWTDGPHFVEKRYKKSGDLRYKQITGCIDASKLPTLIPSDDGGQYDSNGGDGGRGNPTDSSCRGCKYQFQKRVWNNSKRLTLLFFIFSFIICRVG